MKKVKAFAAVLPGLAVPSISSWLDLFLDTRLAHPNWEADARNTALALGAFVAIAICILDSEKGRKKLLSRSYSYFIATIVLVVACLCFYVALGWGITNAYAGILQDFWFLTFIAMLVVMIATIAEASLYLKDEQSKLFWIIVLVSGLLLIGLIAYLVYRLVF
jgi:hypothetical protein